MAVANYRETHGRYPPAFLADADGRPMHSWRVLILPFIEQGELHKQYDFAESWDGPNNSKLAARMPRLYTFSGKERPGNTITNYLAVVGPETVWPGSATVSQADVTDGLGRTILLVENLGADIHWMEPRDLTFADIDLTVQSPRGVSSQYLDPAVAMLDGSLHRLGKDLPPDTLRALFTIRGGEPVEKDNDRGWHWLPDGRDRPLAKD